MTRALIIGGGHNGLVTAALLAKKGVETTVLEANAQVGGMAAGGEFAPGFHAPGAALFLYQLQADVVSDLNLESSLEFARKNLSTVALAEDGRHLKYNATELEGASIESRDELAYTEFSKQMNTFGKLLSTFNNRRPPKLGYGDRDDKFGLAKLAFEVRRLGKSDMRELLRAGASNVFDVLNEWFDSDELKGALALDAVLGTQLGPRSGNSMLTFLHRLSGSYGSLSHAPVRGNTVSTALSEVAQKHGVEIRTNAKVAEVVVKHGRASGVTLENGETLPADIIVSNVDPRPTVFELVGARYFDTGFVRRINNVRMRGNAVRLNLALSELPSISGLKSQDYGQRLVIAPSPDRVERAFNPAKYGEWSHEAVMEFSIPSLQEPELAPPGKHVLSATVQYAPYNLKQGWTPASKQVITEQLVGQLETYIPGIDSLIEARELISPVDMHERYGTYGGHWHHGELSLDQFMFVRPTYGASQYALPLDGLYLCGAGAHPGGGISGAAGRNCAEQILRREGKR